MPSVLYLGTYLHVTTTFRLRHLYIILVPVTFSLRGTYGTSGILLSHYILRVNLLLYNLSVPTMQCHGCICLPSNYAMRHPIRWHNLFHYKDPKRPLLVWTRHFLSSSDPTVQCDVCLPSSSNLCYRVFHSVTYMDRNIKQRTLNITTRHSTPILSLPPSVSWQ